MVEYFKVNPFTVTCAVCVSITFVIFAILSAVATGNWWDNNHDLGYTKSGGDYCEHVNFNRFLREPANSLSNLGFIVLGEIVAIHFFFDILEKRKEKKKIPSNNFDIENTSTNITEYPIWSLLYGLSMMWVGTSSFMFHASLRWLSQTLDVAGIYAMLLYFITLFIFLDSI